MRIEEFKEELEQAKIVDFVAFNDKRTRQFKKSLGYADEDFDDIEASISFKIKGDEVTTRAFGRKATIPLAEVFEMEKEDNAMVSGGRARLFPSEIVKLLKITPEEFKEIINKVVMLKELEAKW